MFVWINLLWMYYAAIQCTAVCLTFASYEPSLMQSCTCFYLSLITPVPLSPSLTFKLFQHASWMRTHALQINPDNDYVNAQWFQLWLTSCFGSKLSRIPMTRLRQQVIGLQLFGLCCTLTLCPDFKTWKLDATVETFTQKKKIRMIHQYEK